MKNILFFKFFYSAKIETLIKRYSENSYYNFQENRIYIGEKKYKYREDKYVKIHAKEIDKLILSTDRKYCILTTQIAIYPSNIARINDEKGELELLFDKWHANIYWDFTHPNRYIRRFETEISINTLEPPCLEWKMSCANENCLGALYDTKNLIWFGSRIICIGNIITNEFDYQLEFWDEFNREIKRVFFSKEKEYIIVHLERSSFSVQDPNWNKINVYILSIPSLEVLHSFRYENYFTYDDELFEVDSKYSNVTFYLPFSKLKKLLPYLLNIELLEASLFETIFNYTKGWKIDF